MADAQDGAPVDPAGVIERFGAALLGATPEALAGIGVRVAGAEFRDGRLVLGLALADGAEVRVYLERRVPEAKAYLRTTHLNVSFRASREDPVVPRLLARIVRRLGEASLEDLAKAWDALPIPKAPVPVGPDGVPGQPGQGQDQGPGQGQGQDAGQDGGDGGPDFGRDGGPQGQGQGQGPQGTPDLENGLHDTWAHPDRWRLFLADSELKRGRDTVVQVDLPWIWVEHGDFECQYVGIGDFVNYPWRLRYAAASERSRPEQGLALGSYTTDMEDVDVISGARPKLEALFEGIRQLPRQPELMSVNCTCVPMMIGDDPEEVVKEERTRVPYPVQYKDQSDDSPYGMHIETLVERTRSAPPVPRDPSAVNLVGYLEGAALDELRAHLADIGIRVHRCAVPRLSPAVMDDWLAASAQIIQENAEFRGMYDHVFGGLDLPTVRPESPYGPRRSIAWLRAVAAAIGRPESAEGLVGHLETRVAQRFEPIAAELRGRGVGIVADARLAARLVDPARAFSIPLLAFLEEMGLAVHVGLFSPDGAPFDPGLSAVFQDPARHPVTFFSTPDELDAFLRQDAIDLVYSDYFYDHRITSAGKTPFSTHVLEMGVEGAIRSIERIRTLVRLPLYRETGRRLSRSAQEAR